MAFGTKTFPKRPTELLNDKVSDTTGDDSSNADDTIIARFLLKKFTTSTVIPGVS